MNNENKPEKPILEVIKLYFKEVTKISQMPFHEQIPAQMDIIEQIYDKGFNAGYHQRDGEKIIDSINTEDNETK